MKTELTDAQARNLAGWLYHRSIVAINERGEIWTMVGCHGKELILAHSKSEVVDAFRAKHPREQHQGYSPLDAQVRCWHSLIGETGTPKQQSNLDRQREKREEEIAEMQAQVNAGAELIHEGLGMIRDACSRGLGEGQARHFEAYLFEQIEEHIGKSNPYNVDFGDLRDALADPENLQAEGQS